MSGTISFDLDGVLRNFTRGFTRIAHELYGTPVGDGPSQQSWFFESFPELGLDAEACDWHKGPIWTRIKSSETFWQDLDPFNTSVMARINNITNKVFITNTVGVNSYEQCVEFLERWGVRNPTVAIATDKKASAIEHNVVAHIDDYLKNCLDLRAAIGDKYIALLYVPYSKIWQPEWKALGGEVVLSVDHFIDECDKRGLTEYVPDTRGV
jgi:FMN phosphatase YigB (HAD superfamily)